MNPFFQIICRCTEGIEFDTAQCKPMGQEADGVCYPIYWEGDATPNGTQFLTKSANKVPASDFDAVPEHTDGKGLKGKLATYEGREVRIVKSFSKGQKLSIEWDETTAEADVSAPSSAEKNTGTEALTNRLWERRATTVWGAKKDSPSE